MSHSADAPDTAVRPVSTGRPPELLPLGNGAHLRRRRLADAAALNAAVIANLDHLRPWMPWARTVPTLAESEQLSASGEQVWDRGTDFMYLLGLDAEPALVIGGFGLHGRIGPGALEIGYWVHREHTGRGLATAAARALTDAALALPGITRAEIHCDESNAASAAVPRRLGYALDRIDLAEPTAPAETGRKMIWVTGA
ncbi:MULTISPECIES: GNAT family N-acetyltransferase [Kitasatospora]|uniref:Putative acetyltransferase n=1 Tax=Kitasatospora setae (strain ATCC 33774 / DSM 43861 / JCM 3304 / KCC A-0304 / NBRC 14216 / KM-6054) TaxID=452652 RepID=E4N950_KITSK|nr:MULTISPECIES: GNAT family N-acetyltransferase [Kitasatospora]BAJ27731.1 putative acetyltransferase [Kitasatospora setae KM-6054]